MDRHRAGAVLWGVCGLLGSALLFYLGADRLHRQGVADAREETEQAVADSLANPVFFQDGIEVEERLRLVATHGRIARIMLLQNDGRLIAAHPPDLSSADLTCASGTQVELRAGAQTVGSVCLVFDPISSSTALLATAYFVGTVLIAMLLASWIWRRIREREAARLVSQADRNARARWRELLSTPLLATISDLETSNGTNERLIAARRRLESVAADLGLGGGDDRELMNARTVFLSYRFLENDYLNPFKALLSDFGYEVVTGERTNRSISRDVIQRIRDSSYFLSVMTASEQGTDESSLAWLYEEKGAAVALAKPVVVLVERGIQKPGAIQGDLELVYFERENFLRAARAAIEKLKAVER